MEILLGIAILCVILSASAAVYFFAEAKGLKALIENKDEMIGILRQELRDWQNKALFVNRLSPLGKETEPAKEKEAGQKNFTPRVATLAQRRARMNDEPSPSITIHASEVKVPNIQETVEKAKEIKAQINSD